MNRVGKLFRQLKREHRCGVIAYITCGDGPTIEIIRALEDAGADAIELGVPFSDPIADGPVIQAAAHRALGNGAKISDIFAIARAIREKSEIPLIAFSYLNPVLRYGIDRFADDAGASGIDSVLLTDLPAEAANEVKPAFKKKGLGSIFLLAPTSSNARIATVDRVSDDFIYYISTMGVTGARTELDPALLTRLDEVRAQVRKPLAVGFGISQHAHFELLKDRCDAIVVGSAIVRAIANGESEGAAERAGAVVRSVLGR
jgi:tryptophan synthase alpha chain